MRYSGLSIAYQASAMVAGFVPTLYTSLLLATGRPWAVAAAVALVTSACACLLAETFRGDISEMEEQQGHGRGPVLGQPASWAPASIYKHWRKGAGPR